MTLSSYHFIVTKAVPETLSASLGILKHCCFCIVSSAGHTFPVDGSYEELLIQTKLNESALFPMQSGCCLHFSCRSWALILLLIGFSTVWTSVAERKLPLVSLMQCLAQFQLKYLAVDFSTLEFISFCALQLLLLCLDSSKEAKNYAS